MDPKADGITLEPDPVWDDRYETERARVEDASDSRLLDVFHVGSTAIPGVPGKPVLDVMPIYAEYEGMRTAADRLVTDGFDRERDDDTIVLVRRDDDHVVAVRIHTTDAEQWRPILVFRDYLTDDPDARAEYARVKREAADAHADDMEAYTDAKFEVVRSLTERAREAGYEERLPEFA
ncbi:GrpB family protein [Halorubrum sp. BOL3-1]|uniref:GrpB family protein n=1 Tax=Halorubrum sp. BOL3-1 TaxID=2497325 RepID=UPI001004E189|nr:GrpB family protein [Halorubrum sp. BOL3-1]QAU12044.1 GrpB family protein [Halorubrum sp. BOL3-1]